MSSSQAPSPSVIVGTVVVSATLFEIVVPWGRRGQPVGYALEFCSFALTAFGLISSVAPGPFSARSAWKAPPLSALSLSTVA
ncbi:MAG: hypothetical protein JWQ36_1788 [Enterovirga sp.]|jgi:hypothetical protein|nr:hypothetical protein [Enterovirga sp.]